MFVLRGESIQSYYFLNKYCKFLQSTQRIQGKYLVNGKEKTLPLKFVINFILQTLSIFTTTHFLLSR